MISGIQFGQNDNWLKKKYLEKLSQQNAQVNQNNPNSTSVNNIQPSEQINGTNQVKSSEKSSSINPAPQEVPWNNLMNSLNLSPQGSKEADMSAIGEKIAQMKAQATDHTQRTQIDNLQQQYDGYKAVAANMPEQAQPKQIQASSSPPEQMIGATQLGEYNKLFIKKKQPELHS